MPEFDDLLNQHKAEIEEEKKSYGTVIQNEIPRDPLRRPWHQQDAPDFIESSVSAGAKKEGKREYPWFASFGGIWRVLRRRWRVAVAGALVAALLISGAAMTVAPSYSSTLHLYAPDKVDSIVSRMNLLTNQLEFASLPIEFRVPISLISRRLRDTTARQWVLEQLLNSEKVKAGQLRVSPDSVHVETFYSAGQELLVIQGFANNPDAAYEVTNLYWKYLENELETIRKAYFSRIDEWIKVRAEALDRDIANLGEMLGKSTAKISGTDGQSPLQARLRNDLADLEMKKLALQKELEVLNASLKTGSLEELRKITDPELQQMLEIRRGLAAEDGAPANYRSHVGEIETEIKNMINRRVDERQLQLQQAIVDRQRYSRQLDSFRSSEGEQQIESEGFRDSQQRMRTLEAQRSDLDKLKAQLALENQVGSVTFKAVQLPFPDVSTVRPTPGFVTGVVFFGSILCGIFLAIGLQIIWPIDLGPRNSRRHDYHFETAVEGPGL